MAEPITIAIQEGTKIPLEVITQTNYAQFTLSLVIGGFFVFYFLWKVIKFDTLTTKIGLFKFKLLTKRNVLLIRHNDIGLFGQMIRESEASKISEALQKFKGKPFDLILHTPGGSLFGALLISRILKRYRGKITSIIPYYAMSGGTMLTLSTDNIVLGEGASLGAVDPQIGGLFGYGSANAWDKVIKIKGKKAKDNSIMNSYLGK